MKSVVGEVHAVDNESWMERGTEPMVALVVMFARRGGAGARWRPAWRVLAPLDVRICILTEQPVARAASHGRGAVSRGTSEVGGR